MTDETVADQSSTAAPAPATFDHWAVVELFGHQRIAGRVREELLAGRAFLRVDVPAVVDPAAGGAEGFTRYYGASAIYSLTPTTEEVARLAAAQVRAAPVSVYIPSTRQLGTGIRDGYHPDDPDFEFDEDRE